MPVLDADDFMVGREDVLAPEAELLVMDFVRDVRPAGVDSCWVTHGAPFSGCYFAGVANLKSWVFVSVPLTVTEAVCAPSLSCQAVIS